MARLDINVGTQPGGQGDGDLLRDAFVKANHNFQELYTVFPVVDTSLNHADPDRDGTIARALRDAGQLGGGTVLLGPGIFTCTDLTLDIPENVVLKGAGRRATVIKVIGAQVGLQLNARFSGVESLKIEMPPFVSGDAIHVGYNYVHLRDLFISGVGVNSWGINADRVNVCNIDNVVCGRIVNGGEDIFTGNGILFHNMDPISDPHNYGDSRLTKVDITLYSPNTTGIKFHGPENTRNVINNILLAQVEVIGSGSNGGCIGLHLLNAKRITCCTVDLENLGVAVVEESVGFGNNISSNNTFISTYVFGSAESYRSQGNVTNRTFIGCDNLTPGSLTDNDAMMPSALWLGNGSTRMRSMGPAVVEMDNGDASALRGFRLEAGGADLTIRGTGSTQNGKVVVGHADSSGVECLPGLVMRARTTPINNPIDGTLAQFAPGVVGAQRGLYQYRGNTWVFIA